MNGVANKQKMLEWIDARRGNHLSHAQVQVQMARELGMSPTEARQAGQSRARTLKNAAPRVRALVPEVVRDACSG